jgi:serine/tyrosine/threonine adenylyltransferase
VIARQAALVAQWMMIGFIHGVMNTDNMSIAGETIDYGPCAFMDAYHPEKVFSSIDRAGRYAYGNQPRIAQWNLARLVETFLPILANDEEASLAEAQTAIDTFAPHFQAAYLAGIRRKLGLLEARDDDLALSQDLLNRMALNEADFTLTFRRLCDAVAKPEADAAVRSLFNDPAAYDEWAVSWRQRLASEGGDADARRAMMRSANPAFIPRNHRVEEAIAAAQNDDFAPFETLVRMLAKPFDDQPEFAAFMDPPRPDQVVRRTFCGT